MNLERATRLWEDALLDRVVVALEIPEPTEDVLRKIANPDFDNAGRVHDWRNYIPAGLESAWESLPTVCRVIAYGFAQEQARNEEWD